MSKDLNRTSIDSAVKSIQESLEVERRSVNILQSHLCMLRRRRKKRMANREQWNKVHGTKKSKGTFGEMDLIKNNNYNDVAVETKCEKNILPSFLPDCNSVCIARTSRSENENCCSASRASTQVDNRSSGRTGLMNLVELLDEIGSQSSRAASTGLLCFADGGHVEDAFCDNFESIVTGGDVRPNKIRPDNRNDLLSVRISPLLSGIFFSKVDVIYHEKVDSVVMGGKCKPGSCLKRAETGLKGRRLCTYILHGAVLPDIGNLAFILKASVILPSLPKQFNSVSKKERNKHSAAAEERCNSEDNGEGRITELTVHFDRVGNKCRECNADIGALNPSTCCTQNKATNDMDGNEPGKTKRSETSGSCSISPFPSNELAELADVAGKVQSIPHLCRNFVAFAEFESRRADTLKLFFCTYGEKRLKIIRADTLRIIISSPNNKAGRTGCSGRVPGASIFVKWRWRFSSICGFGREELLLEHLDETGDAVDSTVSTWVDQLRTQGFDDLIASVGGCDKALGILLQATEATE